MSATMEIEETTVKITGTPMQYEEEDMSYDYDEDVFNQYNRPRCLNHTAWNDPDSSNEFKPCDIRWCLGHGTDYEDENDDTISGPCGLDNGPYNGCGRCYKCKLRRETIEEYYRKMTKRANRRVYKRHMVDEAFAHLKEELGRDVLSVIIKKLKQ